MKNEELYVKSRIGDRNPFRVPEGYFDNFADQLMQQLPEQPHQSVFVRLRPWMYAAACLFVALFSAVIYLYAPAEPGQQAVAATDEYLYVDDAADYVMADNMEIYACLAGEY